MGSQKKKKSNNVKCIFSVQICVNALNKFSQALTRQITYYPEMSHHFPRFL
jgi:hypothetical protein